jgi:hypothetical protein
MDELRDMLSLMLTFGACAMLAGAGPLALLFLDVLLPTKPAPTPPPPRPFVPVEQWPIPCTCPVHGTPLDRDYRCEQCGSGWLYRADAPWRQ